MPISKNTWHGLGGKYDTFIPVYMNFVFPPRALPIFFFLSLEFPSLPYKGEADDDEPPRLGVLAARRPPRALEDALDVGW